MLLLIARRMLSVLIRRTCVGNSEYLHSSSGGQYIQSYGVYVARAYVRIMYNVLRSMRAAPPQHPFPKTPPRRREKERENTLGGGSSCHHTLWAGGGQTEWEWSAGAGAGASDSIITARWRVRSGCKPIVSQTPGKRKTKKKKARSPKCTVHCQHYSSPASPQAALSCPACRCRTGPASSLARPPASTHHHLRCKSALCLCLPACLHACTSVGRPPSISHPVQPSIPPSLPPIAHSLFLTLVPLLIPPPPSRRRLCCVNTKPPGLPLFPILKPSDSRLFSSHLFSLPPFPLPPPPPLPRPPLSLLSLSLAALPRCSPSRLAPASPPLCAVSAPVSHPRGTSPPRQGRAFPSPRPLQTRTVASLAHPRAPFDGHRISGLLSIKQFNSFDPLFLAPRRRANIGSPPLHPRP